MKSLVQPWKLISSKLVGDFRIFKVRSEEKISPRTGKELNFFVIDSVNWVNVVAVTPRQELVMIEQYRHGSGAVELEIPGGMIDAGDGSPLVAGLRELQEETGYSGNAQKAGVIGVISPNPAIMSNRCYTVLVENCELKHPLKFDQGEDIVTRLVPLSEIPELVAMGKIQHALVVVALTYFELRRRGLPFDNGQ